MSQPTRWTITVSAETDLALRRFLGARGMKKGDLSRVVEEVVRWRVFDETVQEMKNRNQDLSPEELEQVIDEQVREARAEKAAQGE